LSLPRFSRVLTGGPIRTTSQRLYFKAAAWSSASGSYSLTTFQSASQRQHLAPYIGADQKTVQLAVNILPNTDTEKVLLNWNGPSGKTTGACKGDVIDHIVPLKRGGADPPDNMQWQTTTAAKAKDKPE
jgi:hypothetical protein